MPPTYRRLQQYAIAISIISVVYNGLEGGLSIGFGAESNSRSLIFFGVQSGIEVISAILVLWRFRKVAKPGEERGAVLSKEDLRFEKFGTLGIGILLLALALATIGSAIAILVLHQEPDSSNASLLISSSALLIMIFIWLPKRYLAKALDSSTMRGEATCSLSCIQITFVLFVGSLIFRVWKGGWWVDGATSIVLAFLFAWEGVEMVRWARNSNFTGGCCEGCHQEAKNTTTSTRKDPETGCSEKGTCEVKPPGNTEDEKETCCKKALPCSQEGDIQNQADCCQPSAGAGKQDITNPTAEQELTNGCCSGRGKPDITNSVAEEGFTAKGCCSSRQ